MNLEEKKALQSLLIDEVQARLEEQPTLLIDALMQGTGPSLLHQLLMRRLGIARNQSGLFEMLLKALMADRGEEAA